MSGTIEVACPHCRAVNRTPAARLAEKPACGRCHQPLFTGAPLELDGPAFELHAARSNVPLLVDFWAEWCGPCKAMAPQFARAAQELEPQLRLGKVETDAVPTLSSRYAIRSIPTLILFRGGREIARQAGAVGAADIVRFARHHLGAG